MDRKQLVFSGSILAIAVVFYSIAVYFHDELALLSAILFGSGIAMIAPGFDHARKRRLVLGLVCLLSSLQGVQLFGIIALVIEGGFLIVERAPLLVPNVRHRADALMARTPVTPARFRFRLPALPGLPRFFGSSDRAIRKQLTKLISDANCMRGGKGENPLLMLQALDRKTGEFSPELAIDLILKMLKHVPVGERADAPGRPAFGVQVPSLEGKSIEERVEILRSVVTPSDSEGATAGASKRNLLRFVPTFGNRVRRSSLPALRAQGIRDDFEAHLKRGADTGC